jgi:hypothetical protein
LFSIHILFITWAPAKARLLETPENGIKYVIIPTKNGNRKSGKDISSTDSVLILFFSEIRKQTDKNRKWYLDRTGFSVFTRRWREWQVVL